MKVYLLKQNQEDGNYWDKTIAVFSNKEKAEEVCKDLNDNYYKPYYHFYEIEEMIVDEKYYMSGKYLDLLFNIDKKRQNN